jgi:nitrogen fixation NifU-like protein
MSYSDTELRRQMILDNYEHPENLIDTPEKLKGYVSASENSASCIDNICAYAKVGKNKKILDIKFSGIGCAIAISSTNIMANKLKNKSLDEAKTIISEYINMIDNKTHKKELLDELQIYDNVYKQLNRIRCAKVGILAINNAINK